MESSLQDPAKDEQKTAAPLKWLKITSREDQIYMGHFRRFIFLCTLKVQRILYEVFSVVKAIRALVKNKVALYSYT